MDTGTVKGGSSARPSSHTRPRGRGLLPRRKGR
jgi:hypothetical protein